jgi:hypothetical protein
VAGREEETVEVLDLGEGASPADVETFRELYAKRKAAEISSLHRRILGWASRVAPIEEGTVQQNGKPDAWAWVMLLALVASGSALGFALFDQTSGMGIGTPLGLLSLALAFIGAGLKSIKR